MGFDLSWRAHIEFINATWRSVGLRFVIGAASTSRLASAMPREGPCAAPGCVDPDNASQWQFVPEPFATAHGVAGRCVCKRGDCLRWCGLKEPKQQPGRRAAKRSHAEAAAVGALLQPEHLPCPPIIVSIDEIWAVRCADVFSRSRRTPSPPTLSRLLCTCPSCCTGMPTSTRSTR